MKRKLISAGAVSFSCAKAQNTSDGTATSRQSSNDRVRLNIVIPPYVNFSFCNIV